MVCKNCQPFCIPIHEHIEQETASCGEGITYLAVRNQSATEQITTCHQIDIEWIIFGGEELFLKIE